MGPYDRRHRLLAYLWYTYFRIKRERARDREKGEAAE